MVTRSLCRVPLSVVLAACVAFLWVGVAGTSALAQEFGEKTAPQSARSGAVALTDPVGQVHFIGGYLQSQSNPSRAHEIYNPDRDQWETGPQLEFRLRGACGATDGRGKLYLFGGNTGETDSRETLFFDVAADRWFTGERAPTTIGTDCAATLGADGKIYVLGGRNQPDKYFVYDPSNDEWEDNRDMAQPLFGHAAHTMRDGRIYVVGGFTGDELSDKLFILDPATGNWDQGPSMPSARTRFASAQLYGRQIFVIGGANSPNDQSGQSFDEVFVYDRRANTWQQDSSLPSKMRAGVAASFGTTLFAFGGRDQNQPVDATFSREVQAKVAIWGVAQDASKTLPSLNNSGSWKLSFLSYDGREELADVEAFDAVVAMVEDPLGENGDHMGDVLAAYVAGGGGVVETSLGNFAPNHSIGGQWRALGLTCMGETENPFQSGDVEGFVFPDHPLVWGVPPSFEVPQIRTGQAALSRKCLEIIRFVDQQTFAAVQMLPQGRVTWLGMMPEAFLIQAEEEHRYGVLANAIRWSLSGEVGQMLNVAPRLNLFPTAYSADEGSALTLRAAASDRNADVLSYAWDLDNDGQFDDAFVAQPTITVGDGPATQVVRLRVSDWQGLSVVRSATITINNVAPVVVAVNAPPDPDESAQVAFSVSSVDPAGEDDPLSFQWSFGDGESASGANVDHTYEDNGTFTYSVTVSDDDNGTDTEVGTLVVADVPPTLNPVQRPVDIVEGQSVSFSTLLSKARFDVVDVIFSWGDGSANDTVQVASGVSNQNVAASHTFDGNNVARTVTVTATDDDGTSRQRTSTFTVLNAPPQISTVNIPGQGNEGQSLAFTAAATDPGNDSLTYTWDFGDGTTATGTSVNHIYTNNGVFTVTLTVEDGDDGQVTASDNVFVSNVAPVVSLSGPQSGQEAQALSFVASANDPGNDTLTYTWDFGDGNTVTAGPQVTHVYSDNNNGPYTVTVTVNDGNASTVDSLGVTINNVAPTINTFNVPEQGDEGQALSFSAAATDPAGPADPLTFSWNFGDGSPPVSGSQVTHTFADNGAYTITLTVEDDDGAADTRSETLVINNLAPQINALTGDFVGIEGQQLNYTASANDPGADTLTYRWDFGDGDVEEGVNLTSVSHAYTSEDNYTLTLTVTDDDGQATSINRTVSVGGSEPVITSLDGDTTGPEGQAFDFVAQAIDPNGDPIIYTWEFGDGSDDLTGVNLNQVSHTYVDDGTYTLTLTVSDGEGQSSATLELQVANVAPVFSSFTVPPSLNEGSQGALRATVNDAAGNNDPVTVTWNFGDGSPSATGTAVDHTWTNNGTFTVTATATDGDGGETTQTADVVVANVAPSIAPLSPAPGAAEGASISLSATVSDPGADTLSYLWEFGDGTAPVEGVDLTEVNHTYADNGTYTVRLTVNDGTTQTTRTLSQPVSNVAPTLQNLAGDQQGAEGQSLSFSATSTDPAGVNDPLTWTWDFGDGTDPVIGSALTNISHTYADNGTYTLRVTVADGDGGQDEETLGVTITNAAPNIASVTGPQSADEGQSVAFVAVANDPGNDNLTYTWDFGDGQQEEGADLTNVNHTWADNGTFTVTLTVTDDDGSSDQDTVSITITNVAPTLTLFEAPANGTEEVALTFRAAANDPGNDNLTYTWNFGDDNTATGTEVQHAYADNGTFNVQLTVTDGDGGQVSDDAAVVIANVAPVLVRVDGPAQVVEGSAAAFVATVSDAAADEITVQWGFEQGPNLTGLEAQHTYADDGEFEVTVVVSDDDGGQDTDVIALEVLNADPVIVSLTGDFVGQQGDTYNFTATATDPGDDTLTFNWNFGDGTTATGASVSHVYTQQGQQTLRLTVTDEDGGSTSTTRTVGVAVGAPVITSLGGDTEGAEGQLLSFTAEAVDPTNDPVTFTWNFGDGSDEVTGAQVTHTYADQGTYEVLVVVSDGEESTAGALSVQISNANPTIDTLVAGAFGEGSPGTITAAASDPGDDTLSFRWDFGDGTEPFDAPDLEPVQHTYATSGTYTVALTVTDEDGGAVTGTVDVSVGNAPPVIAQVDGDFTGPEGQALSFEIEASDPGGDTLTYEWTFGDDEPIETDAPQVSVTFEDNGTVAAVVRAIDTNGQFDEFAFEVEVTNVAPVIEQVSGPEEGNEGDLFAYVVRAEDPGNDTLSYSWDFGDGTQLPLAEGQDRVEHIYGDQATVTVTVTVQDDDGAETTATIEVTVANVAPSLADISAPQSIEEGLQADFAAQAQDPGDDTVTFEWDFGDGGTDIGQSVTHVYGDDGVQEVVLTLRDEDGGERAVTRTLTVLNAAPVFLSDPTELRANQEQLYTYAVEVTDPGFDDVLTLELTEGPEGMTLEDDTVLWTPTAEQVALGVPFDVTLVVSDDDGASTTQSWQVRPTVNDNDNDGVPDDCEEAFGLNLNEDDGDLDNDRDGLSNREECLRGTDPTVSNGPSAPTIDEPEDGARVATALPRLKVNNATDPDNDPLTYTFDLFSDRDLVVLVASYEGVQEGLNTTASTVEVVLEENTEYCWRARASDPFVAGPFSEVACFVVDAENEPPSVPNPLLPSGTAQELQPELVADPAVDPEGGPLVYLFEVYDGEETEDLVASGQSNTPSFVVDVILADGGVYNWRVAAVDDQGTQSGFSQSLVFTVDASNAIPGPPTILSPEDGDRVVEGPVVLLWRNSVDLDGDVVTYEVEVATTKEFDEVVFSLSEIPEQDVETSIEIEGLDDDATYFARVRGHDGRGAGLHANVSFSINLDNQAPTAPEALSPEPEDKPEAGQDVELVVENAVDPDGDALTYTFRVFDLDGETLLDEQAGVAEGEQVTMVVLDAEVIEGREAVLWQALAVDELGLEGPPSELRQLQGITDGVGVDGDGQVDGGCGCTQIAHQSRRQTPGLPWAWSVVGLLGMVWWWRRRR